MPVSVSLGNRWQLSEGPGLGAQTHLCLGERLLLCV